MRLWTYIGAGLWWLFLTVATVIIERIFGGIPLSALVAVAILLGVAAIPLMFWHQIRSWRETRSFDMPIREAVDHYVRTFPHSYKDGADQHAFEVLHKAMCSGELPVMGAKGEDGPSKRISAKRCKRLKPTMVVVPKNWASLQGVRFDLNDESKVPEPLVETDQPMGFTGLRVRSSELYSLWPKNQEQ